VFAIAKSLRWNYTELISMPIPELISFYNLVVEQWKREEAEIEKSRNKTG